MPTPRILFTVLLMTVFSTAAAAQGTACKLLTSADIASTIGEQVAGPPNPADMPGQHTIGCMRGVMSKGMITAMVMPSRGVPLALQSWPRCDKASMR